MCAHDEENIGVKAFKTMKEELKQLKYQRNHCIVKLENTMSSSGKVETLHDVIASKNELIKWLRETFVNLKSQLIDSSTLNPSDTLRNLFSCIDNISQLNIDEAIITTPRLSKRDQMRHIKNSLIQLKECWAKIHEKYSSLRNAHGFEKELRR